MILRPTVVVGALTLLGWNSILPSQQVPSQQASQKAASIANTRGMVWIPGGTAMLGSQEGDPDAPLHRVELDGFWLDRTEVTNAQFAQFVAATGYVTVAERKPTPEELPGVPPEALVAGSLVFRPPGDAVDLREFWRWWEFVPGACWRRPDGPGSAIAGRDLHPVVHICYQDAIAFCKWAKKRLPTEAEWEYAARGGLDQKRYVWGDSKPDADGWVVNIWQGEFPRKNERRDGFATTAPVATYPANGHGLYDMSGNVWEWCHDLYHPRGYGDPTRLAKNPQGPRKSFDPMEPGAVKHVMRGGSFLCSDVYCLGYLPGTRMKSTPDTSLCHTGFRCALTAPAPKPDRAREDKKRP
ncbi:MAG: formylglycine-generating enzyme family protein [bacterium]|nr:formylglycine-generating enzyme family protein [bacterium]